MARARIRHELKCWPEFFQPTLNGIKRFELRRDDRPEGFQVGDELLEREWDPTIEEPYGPGEGGKYKGYTGREVLVRVDYVLRAEDINPTDAVSRPDSFLESIKAVILQPGFVIMSISLVS